MRNKFIAGNWKMHNVRSQARDLIENLKGSLSSISKTTVMIAPSFTNLALAAELLGGSKIFLGAQNVYWEDHGAYTGEISPVMLKEIGCRYVILGHSERRQYFKETDQDVNRKINAVIRHEMLPIICVGETLEQREQGAALAVVEHQVRNCLEGYTSGQAAQFTIAYEPVWAIGTGKAATPADAVQVHQAIRQTISDMFGNAAAETIRIQYGGSVNAENINSFIREPQIDGALVGGACLKADSFTRIVLAAENN
jgi:triosephosphate isomerase